MTEKAIKDEVAYIEKIDRYFRLDDIIEDLIVHQLDERKIKSSGIKSRVKTWKSFEEKCRQKDYDHPILDCTDILGVRIIVYLETDIDKVEAIVRELFSINERHSIDKRNPDSKKEFGYRSLHLIWREVIPFFAFPPAVRKIIYTTNAIESLNRVIRKTTKTRGSFPTDDAATKLIYLAVRNFEKAGRSVREWVTARNQFAILYPERFNK